MTIEDNKAIVRRAFEALMSDDLNPLDDLLSPDCVLHQCGFLEPIRGVDAIKSLPGGDGPISRQEVRLERIAGDGDTVAIHWSTIGTCLDPESSEGARRPVSFMSMSFLQLEGGKITEIWNIQDMSTMWAQLAPPDGSEDATVPAS